MLQLRPICENCGKSLPNESGEAMICKFECTFCADCVEQVLKNVCPNCGGGFEKRPTRPTHCLSILRRELSGDDGKKIQACRFTKIQKAI